MIDLIARPLAVFHHGRRRVLHRLKGPPYLLLRSHLEATRPHRIDDPTSRLPAHASFLHSSLSRRCNRHDRSVPWEMPAISWPCQVQGGATLEQDGCQGRSAERSHVLSYCNGSSGENASASAGSFRVSSPGAAREHETTTNFSRSTCAHRTRRPGRDAAHRRIIRRDAARERTTARTSRP